MDETTHTPEDTQDAAPTHAEGTDLGLQQELQAAHAKAAENLEGWQRAQAEFANYKKRMARDQEAQEAEIRGRVIKRYLEIVDDLELAFKNQPEAAADWGQGIELIYRKLLSFLEAEGVQRVDPLGQPFDANLHEAVAQEASSQYTSGTVSEVLRTGYTLGERVLRPAVVKVAQ